MGINLGKTRRLIFTDPPLTSEEIANELGVSRNSFTVARDAIHLFDEEDISEDEVGLVAEAMRLITSGEYKSARDIIAPMMAVRFGDPQHSGKSALGGPITARNIQRERFDSAFVSLVDHIQSAATRYVPYLNVGDRNEYCDDIDRSIELLRDMKKTISKGGTNVG